MIQKLLIFAILSLFVAVFVHFYESSDYLAETNSNKMMKSVDPVIVWWTPFTGIYERQRKCLYGSCILTENRSMITNASTGAILFYGSDFAIEDLPIPKRNNQLWAVLHEESPKNQPLFDHDDFLSIFNITSTFKEASSVPLTLQYLQNLKSLTSLEYFMPLEKKNVLAQKLSPLMYMQSDCDTPSERDEYVKLLSKYIQIDSYGKCLNNLELPDNLENIESMRHPKILELISKYKFTLSIENAACDDYITEKLWRPLCVGSIPVYWGSPSVDKWLPNNHSIINIRDFKSSKELATYLHKVMNDDDLYQTYLDHKVKQIVTNTKLKTHLLTRKYGVADEDDMDNFVEYFECFLCDELIKLQNDSRVIIANGSHYGCPAPETVLTRKPNPTSSWLEQWSKARVEANVLLKLIRRGKHFSMKYFYDLVIDSLKSDGHFERFLPLMQ